MSVGGWLTAILNLLGMGGGPAIVPTAGTVCGVVATVPALGGMAATVAAVGGTVVTVASVGGVAGLEEC